MNTLQYTKLNPPNILKDDIYNVWKPEEKLFKTIRDEILIEKDIKEEERFKTIYKSAFSDPN